ncbi:hypothetical protein [Nocardia sp. CNY236]|uniref:hypothetical protein n=1 Tax=Nocardia sp. CNY236 TaxID=1169152 RepID=UPI0003F7D8B6|nr:hypothetical protein [Nocardia sp. CNY236]
MTHTNRRPPHFSPNSIRTASDAAKAIVGLAQLQTHQPLTLARVRGLTEPVEQIVLPMLAEAMDAAEPDIFARVTTGFPDLSPASEVTVRLLRRGAALEVQIHGTANPVDKPVADTLTAFAERGRVAPPSGGTLTWVRIPLATTPPVSLSSRSVAS